MSSLQIEIRKGRVAPTGKANAALNLHKVGLWSCVTSEGVYHKDNAHEGAAPHKLLDCLFYTDKSDAREESAYLHGRSSRPPGTEQALLPARPSTCAGVSARQGESKHCRALTLHPSG